jgi:hypothetical protein
LPIDSTATRPSGLGHAEAAFRREAGFLRAYKT